MCNVDWQPRQSFLVAIDSDGCAFDSMEIKIRACFMPQIISTWELQAIAPLVHEVGEFVNLYSRGRGKNRFAALLQFFDLLREHPGIRAEAYAPPDLSLLRRLLSQHSNLDQDMLRDVAAQQKDAELHRIVFWNERVNAAVKEAAGRVQPFPLVRQSLEKLAARADVLVTSVAPQELLQQQWHGHGLDAFVRALAGQEAGNKVTHLKVAQRYGSGRRLMIGDAPSDLAAAQARAMAFYPILPGREIDSWRLFYDEIMDLFLRQKYTPTIENQFIGEFLHLLPEQPAWKR